VSENRENRQYVSIPAAWGLPKFALSSRIKATTVTFGKKIKTGEIIGIEYLSPESPQVQQGIKAGWSYIIKIDIDPEEPWYRNEQTLCIYESDIISELAPQP
jgi:hypothetical protein